MRVFVPLSPQQVGDLATAGQLPGLLEGIATTPDFSRWIDSDNPEDLEYAALSRAGDLALLHAESNLRIVAVADVDGAQLEISDEPPGTILLNVLTAAEVVSLHVDDPVNKDVIARARQALAQDDESGEQELADVDDCELLWFDAVELADVASQVN